MAEIAENSVRELNKGVMVTYCSVTDYRLLAPLQFIVCAHSWVHYYPTLSNDIMSTLIDLFLW